jgi:hypothetical protein
MDEGKWRKTYRIQLNKVEIKFLSHVLTQHQRHSMIK